MEAILFCGIQGSGKSSFYVKNFFDTHIHISLDIVKTRHREKELVKKCIELSQSFVIDNTNPSISDRERYFALLKGSEVKVVGYFFESKIEPCLLRNSMREGHKRIPEVGVKGTRNKLEFPRKNEGFDELYFVRIGDEGFEIEEWINEV